jgi:hypothetical protein
LPKAEHGTGTVKLESMKPEVITIIKFRFMTNKLRAQ